LLAVKVAALQPGVAVAFSFVFTAQRMMGPLVGVLVER
jgi:hypothetical protein